MKPSKYHHLIRHSWIALVAFFTLIPTISWGYHANIKDALTLPTLTMTLIGQITGIIGAQLFALTLMLSTRLRSLERLFGGLDRMYVMHHRIGTIAFSLLAVHPLILAFRFFGDSMEEVMNFLLPFGNTVPKELGIYSLLVMIMLLFATFYGKIFSYRLLKNAHRFMGLAFFVGALHMYLIPSSMSTDIVLKVFCLTTAGLGITAFVYRTLLGAFLVPRYKYTVSLVQKVSQDVVELTLKPVKKAMLHFPGQFAMLSIGGGFNKEEHPFTISSPGDDGTIRFSVKALGDYTSTLDTVKVGAPAKLEGPFGEFTYHYGEKKQVWIAGGIGVTPFVAMAEALLKEENIPYTIDFFYSIRSEKDATYREVFEALAKKHPSFVFHCMPSDVAGFVTGQGVVKIVSEPLTRSFFICGPPPMMSALIGQLRSEKVKMSSIHTERFALLK